MSKIKTIKAFKEGIDAAFETLKTRDEARRASRARTCGCTPSSGPQSRPQGNRPTSRRECAYSQTRTCMFTIANMHVYDCGYACSQSPLPVLRLCVSAPLR